MSEMAAAFAAAAGSLISGIGGFQAGTYNARVARQNARNAAIDANAQEAQVRRDARAIAGDAIAAMGASGSALGTGSALDLLRESATNAEMDALNIRRRGAYEYAAGRAEARMARRQGAFTLASSVLKAGSQVAGGMQESRNNAALNAPRSGGTASSLLYGGTSAYAGSTGGRITYGAGPR